MATKQPVTLAAMEALWETQPGAPLVILGQPNVAEQKMDNPIVVPKALSFLTWRHWNAEVQGLNHVPKEDWPDNIPLLYYAYHIMVGLGTIFIAISAIAACCCGAISYITPAGCSGSWCCWRPFPTSPTPPAG